MKKFSRPVQTLFVAGCVMLAAVGQASAQTRSVVVSDARVAELAAQAMAQVQGRGQEQASAASEGPRTPLTMDEAVARALKMNIELTAERLNPQIQDWGLAQSRAAFLPTATANLGYSDSTTQPASVIGGGEVVSTGTTTYNFGASQVVRQTGGTASLSFNNNRTNTTNSNATRNPQYRPAFQLQFQQPLLRNFKIDASRQSLLTAAISRRLADVSLRAVTLNTIANTRNAYWDLVYAIQAVEAAKTSLALAQKLVEDNKVKVEIGTLAPIDIVSAEAEAATRQGSVVTAEATRRTAELALKRLVVSGTDDPLWNQVINPTDRPPTDVLAKVDIEGAIRKALEQRTDLVTSRKNLESSEINLRYQKNQTLPSANLTASYQVSGTSGNRYDRGVLVEASGYWDGLAQLYRRDQPTWNLSVQVSYPIGTSSQQATYARAKLQFQQAEANLRALELSVATDVTSAALNVQSTFQQVQTASAARALSLRRLEAVQSKFEVGMATNYEVVLAQRDYADAQNNELRMILNHRKALVDFERKLETASR